MATSQMQVVALDEPRPNQILGQVALFNADGTPWEGGGGGGGGQAAGLNQLGFARAIYLTADAVAPGGLPPYTQILRLQEN